MTNVRFFVLIMTTAISLVLGVFGRSWWDIGSVFDYCGYWTVAALVVVWVVMAAAILRAGVRTFWCRLRASGLIWVLLAWLFLIGREPTEFKVLMDEPMLVSASQGMHFQRSTTIPLRSYEIGGSKEYWGSFQDKRPPLFPFILSLVHDATGYRVENVFWLNKVLLLVFLILAWLAGNQLDEKLGGGLAMLWFCGWPILAQNACGGGFEIFNLTLIIIVFLAARRFLANSDDRTEAFLLCSCQLLAHTRYESVLYVLVFAGIWLVRSIASRRWTLSWFTAVSPLFLIPVLWQREIVSVHGEIWQLGKGNDHAFGIDFVYSNLRHASRFLFEPNPDFAGSPFFGALGLLALMGLGLCLVRKIRAGAAIAPELKALCWVGGIVAASFGVLLSYHWGQLDDPVVSRLILPLVGLMGFACCAVRPFLFPTVQVGRLILGIMAFWVVGYALPVMNQHLYSQHNIHMEIFRWARLEIGRVGSRSPLIISSEQMLWSIHEIQALSLPEAASRLPQIEFHRSVRTYDDVFLIQDLVDDPTTRQKVPLQGSRFADGVALETVAEKSFYPFKWVVRISRIKKIDLDHAAKSDR